MNALVLGGGIAGLAHAHQLKKYGHPVTLIEESNRAGGVMGSEKIDDHLLEFGPNTVVPTPELMELIYSAGLAPHLQMADAKSPRYVLYKNKLRRIPTRPLSFLMSSLLSFSGKLRLLQEPFVAARHESAEETLYDFSMRRLGIEATENLLAPFVSGVWAGDTHELSADSAFPQWARWEKDHGSLLKGLLRSKKVKSPTLPKGLVSFRYGLQALPQALAADLGDTVHLGEKILKIERNETTQKWMVGTERGVHTADRLISSLPAGVMAEMAQAWAPSLARALAAIPYASLTVVHLSVAVKSVGHSLKGFGYLAAPSENAPLLGCLFSSSLFTGRAPDGHALLTVFIKGKADAAAVEKARRSVAATLSISEPMETLSTRVHRDAIPQYTRGHRERLAVIAQAEKEWPGLVLIGNYLEGISVGDVVRQSFQKAF